MSGSNEEGGGRASLGRRSGILLHPTSLPGPGIGDLGDEAYRFVDWLARAGQSYWQILPLGPVDPGGSPYNGLSAMAGNPLLISLDRLGADGLLDPPDCGPWEDGSDHVDYAAVTRWKDELLHEAHRAFNAKASSADRAEFERFQRENVAWLDDYALFRAARDFHDGLPWIEWAPELKARDADALKRWRARLAPEIDRYAFQQFIFDRQWRRVRAYANRRGIRIIGDVPIFVALDSADVWANPEIFELDEEGRPTVVAGVPPDYFSETGQRWGNPLYRWDVLRSRGYDWWIERFRRAFQTVDLLRVDHFRGFESYWEIDSREETAVNGRWVQGPGRRFFDEVERRLGKLPLVAEDLGIITRDVERLRDELGLPGMCVLQFAFDGDAGNPHLPENCRTLSLAYTGTHDNDTITGWWSHLNPEERERVVRWLDGRSPIHWTFVEAVFTSPAAVAIVPIQDVLGWGSEARMNTPGVASDNWTWRLQTLPGAAEGDRLRDITARTRRLSDSLAAENQSSDPERDL